MTRWQLTSTLITLGLLSFITVSQAQANESPTKHQPWSEHFLRESILLNIEPGLLDTIYQQYAKSNPDDANDTATNSLPIFDKYMYVLYNGSLYWVTVLADPTVFMSRAPNQDFIDSWERQRIKADRLPNTDPNSFIDLGFGYAKDQHQVYDKGKVMIGADPLTFDVIDKKTTHEPNIYYTKDRQHVYYAGKIIPKAEPNSFSLVTKYATYSTDNQMVYLNGQPCANIDVASFEALNYWVARDKNSVYILCKELKGFDIENFELISSTSTSPVLLKNKNGVYWVNVDYSNKQNNLNNWAEQKIQGADPKTFQLLINSYNQDGLYGRDNKQVYYDTKPIIGADPNTFRMLTNTGYGADKKKLYHYNQPLRQADFENNFYNLYDYLAEDGLYPIAIKYLSQILSQKHHSDANIYYLFRAQAYTEQNEFEKAISDYKSAIRLLKRTAYEDYEILDIYMKLIPLYIKLKQYNLARSNIVQAEAFISQNSGCDRKRDLLNELKADIYVARNETDAALKIYQTIKNNIGTCYQYTSDKSILSWIETIHHKLEKESK